jgi:hypothetical protein
LKFIGPALKIINGLHEPPLSNWPKKDAIYRITYSQTSGVHGPMHYMNIEKQLGGFSDLDWFLVIVAIWQHKNKTNPSNQFNYVPKEFSDS